jgi:hypothetical protein
MNDSPLWLWIPVTYLFAICWLGAIGVTWKVTVGRSVWHRCLWCVAVFFFPITGFLAFAWRHRVAAVRPSWKWLVAYVILIVLGTASYAIARHRAIVHVGVRPLVRDRGEDLWFKKDGTVAPALCVAMSGGGIRSAAFNIGVLRALHENGLLARTDVMSAVSGGSYALSWYLLQQYYAQQPGGAGLSRKDTLDAMFDWKGDYQRHLALHARQFGASGAITYYIGATISGFFTLTSFNVLRLIQFGEDSSARSDYRESIRGTFQRERYPKTGETLNEAEQVVGQDVTFVDLATFAKSHDLPFFVFVTTVDVDADDQPGTKAKPPSRLWPSIFELNAWGLGSDSYGYASWKDAGGSDIRGDFARQRWDAVRLVNVAPAISGAALSPASGGLSVQGRLLMSLGYLDLGYRVPRFMAGDVGSLYLSDGGHAENLGLYPLVRRDCRNIIVIDAEHEPEPRYRFEAYFKVRPVLEKEMTRTLSIAAIDEGRFDPATPVVRGTISASSTSLKSDVFYVKLAKNDTRDYGEPISNPALGPRFPQDPTSDQNFGKLKFEAYRELGYLLAHESTELTKLAQQLHGKD